MILLSFVLSNATSRVQSLNSGSQAQNSKVPQLTLNITDWWNAPIAINSVKIGEQEVVPGSSVVATDDWARHLSIEAINKSEKTISYIAYAIDFTVAGEDKLYRIRLQDGTFYAFPGALTVPDGLRVLKGQTHNMRFTENAWGCHSTLVSMINERKTRVANVELFVESVGFTDDTLWAFGSHLKRNKETSVFENIEHIELSKGKNRQSTNLARGFVADGTSATSFPDSGCCVITMNYTSGGAKPVTVTLACSACPPSAGGGTCPPPVPTKDVNSLNGPGSSGINMTGFTHCG
jgi:hypothetical protein